MTPAPGSHHAAIALLMMIASGVHGEPSNAFFVVIDALWQIWAACLFLYGMFLRGCSR